MKILKIEIQNINSLKTKEPIVIDFESDTFKDVGLYAIVGSTGAGKTTILDAITIGLYHQVPRLNNANSKNLSNVVSFGTTHAYVCITFENNNQIFEATWTIKLTATNNKLLKTPKEEVRFKNLTTETILGEKKREVQTEIIKVIQLDYNQFLRSVLLAQGDFASFLSAKGTEKAKLLEQITGEQIYKKIGEAIALKRKDSKDVLERIRASINDVDLLSSEDKTNIEIEKTRIDKAVLALDVEEKKHLIIKDWYVRFNENTKKDIALQKELEVFQSKIIAQEPLLSKLVLHEKALPYQDQIKEIARIDKELNSTTTILSKISQDLQEMTILLPSKEANYKTCKKRLTENEKDFNTWLKKLEIVSKYDADLDNLITQKKELEKGITLLQTQTRKLELEKDEFGEKMFLKNKESKVIEQYLELKKNTPNLEANFANWSFQLNTITKNTETLIADKKELKKVLAFKEETAKKLQNLTVKKQSQQDLTKRLEKTQQDFQDYFKINNLEKLQKEKERIIDNANKWKTLKLYANEYLVKNKNNTELKNKNKASIIKLTSLKQQISETESKFKTTKESVEDYRIIHQQNIKIQSFEKERELLNDGEACGLCGATEHPFVTDYKDNTLSESGKELQKRENIFDSTNQKLQELKILLASTNSSIKSNEKHIILLENEMSQLTAKAQKLDLDTAIYDVERIHEMHNITENEFRVCNQKIDEVASKLIKYEETRELITKNLTQTSSTEKDISTFSEKQKNQKEIIEKKNSAIKKNIKTLFSIREKIQPQFDKNALEFPEVPRISSFLAEIKEQITDYNTKIKEKLTLKQEISVLETELKNNKKTRKEKQIENTTKTKDLQVLLEKIKETTKQRIVLLAANISVSQQRNTISKALTTAKEKLEKSFKSLQDLITKNTDSISKKKTFTDELERYKIALEFKNSLLSEELHNSVFHDKEAVINALLSKEVFEKYNEIKNNLDKNRIALNTLSTTIKTENEALSKQKDFDISLEKLTILIQELKQNNLRYSTRLGEISEKLKKNNEIIKRNKSVYTRIQKQEEQLEKWVTLMDITGGSKDAFNRYVQQLTLQHLIGLANVHLHKLNKRYALQIKKDNSLNLNLIDKYQAGEIRDIDTSSGGEKFLISLALALGLSDLASHNVKIDSLFIDEGFGSLDNNTLETVITALETFQAQGKIIGIISHVDSLKERIATQIQVIKKNNGVSVVHI